MVNGKAKLCRDDYCDGLGDCLPACPTGAISFEQREAAEYNEDAVKNSKQNSLGEELLCGCSSTESKIICREKRGEPIGMDVSENKSQLSQWPVQIKLVSINAPYFTDANLLIAADCTAFAYGDFHNRFIKNRITLIGCSKLDEGDYSDKLTEIIKRNSIKSVTVVRMEVPCCGGIENAVKTALQNSGKFIPWQVVTISSNGKIIE